VTTGRRTALAAALFLGVAGAVVSPAEAAQPAFERITVDDTFDDVVLAEACGVPEVTTTVSGTVITRALEDSGTGALALDTVNLSVTIQAGDNTARLRDVGASLLRRTPDGSLILSITGQIPFEFRGVLKLDPETDEAILEPKDWDASDLQRVCDALAA
jgi:hypothetical protein